MSASFVYQDNWGRAIRHTATILNDLIPHVYDVERTIRILGEDGKEELIDINKAVAGDGMEDTERVLNDVTVGAYDVVFRPGPSFSTRREEAREGMTAFLQSSPNAAPLVLDLIAKLQDWPNADKIGKRLEHLLPEPIRQRESGRTRRAVAAAAGRSRAGSAHAGGRARLQAELQQARSSRTRARRSTTSGARIELAAMVRGGPGPAG